MTQLAHRIKLKPSRMAVQYFRRACGTSRFAYNWALSRWQEKYQSGEKWMSGFSLVKEFNAIKTEKFPWTSEVSKWATQKAIQDLGDAFAKFFQKKSKYPRFKKKGKSRDSFYLGAGAFSIDGKHLWVPKLGQVKMTQRVRFPGILRNVVISREGISNYNIVLFFIVWILFNSLLDI